MILDKNDKYDIGQRFFEDFRIQWEFFLEEVWWELSSNSDGKSSFASE